MKTSSPKGRRRAGFTLVEVMVSMTVFGVVMSMCLGTFLFGLRAMYKDTQRLATNASLRSFMAQVTKETLDASYFYVFPYYTKLNGSVNLTTGPATMTQIEDAADDDYDKWVGQGDCLVLVTNTSVYRTTDIRQIRIYYRVTTNQASMNAEAPIRYYETADWGEGTAGASNGHTNLATELNAINLNSNPLLAGTRLLSARTLGRSVPSPYTPYAAGDRYPVFSSESPNSTPTNGFISINMEFVNGSTANQMLSSSSFNYTISPRR
jgi:prepilin-type N-terminal cleavage/methylation domain-containing protein